MKKIKFKFKPGATVETTDDFWYALFDGGYARPKELLVDKEQVKLVDDAVSVLYQLRDQGTKAGVILEN